MDEQQGGNEGMMTCPTCQQQFATQEELDRHVQEQHGNEGEVIG